MKSGIVPRRTTNSISPALGSSVTSQLGVFAGTVTLKYFASRGARFVIAAVPPAYASAGATSYVSPDPAAPMPRLSRV